MKSLRESLLKENVSTSKIKKALKDVEGFLRDKKVEKELSKKFDPELVKVFLDWYIKDRLWDDEMIQFMSEETEPGESIISWITIDIGDTDGCIDFFDEYIEDEYSEKYDEWAEVDRDLVWAVSDLVDNNFKGYKYTR